jgi:hypothetical protein
METRAVICVERIVNGEGQVATACRPVGIPSMDRMLFFVEIKK